MINFIRSSREIKHSLNNLISLLVEQIQSTGICPNCCGGLQKREAMRRQLLNENYNFEIEQKLLSTVRSEVYHCMFE